MTLPARFTQRTQQSPVILPSLLLCDFARLGAEVADLEALGTQAFHLDVMDGHFVPNLTYGMPIVEAVRKSTDTLVDVHLMIERPERYIKAFRSAGADVITVHVEAVSDAPRAVAAIKEAGAAAGIALNPATPLASIQPCLNACDVVLVMSVPAGFGGQPFDRGVLEKLDALREWNESPNHVLAIDGGINRDTIGDAVLHGADWLVVGSAIFRAENRAAAISGLRDAAQSAADNRAQRIPNDHRRTDQRTTSQ